MHIREELYRERRNRVESVCRSAWTSNLWKNEFVGKDFLIDMSNRLAYCRHGKVGCLYFLFNTNWPCKQTATALALYVTQVATSTWMKHFITISHVLPETKKPEVMNLTIDELHKVVPKFLYVGGQDSYNFDVDKFSKDWGLFTFSFVRHPFDRWEYCLTQTNHVSAQSRVWWHP